MPPSGLTKDAGWQIGVRKTLPIGLAEAWDLLFSEEGLRAWLGDLPGFHAVKGAAFELSDGTRGEFTVFKKHSHARLTWHSPGYPRRAITQVRVIPDGEDKTVFAFHQEQLPSEEARKERRAFFKRAVKRIEELVGKRERNQDRETDS